MLRHYLRTIRALLVMLQELALDPFDKKDVVLAFQERLLGVLSRIERRMTKVREERNGLKRTLATRDANRAKQVSKQIKNKITGLENKFGEYQFLHQLFRSIGDGLPFLYMDRFDLKPQNFKESPGFLTGKKGSRLERKIFRYVFANGHIAILNDLTNVLKYGDVTVVVDKGVWYPFEIKSGKSQNPVQQDKAETLFQYVQSDVPADLYGIGIPMKRVEGPDHPITHVAAVNAILTSVRKVGFGLQILEPGFILLASRGDVAEDIKTRLTELQLLKPLFFTLEENFVSALGYYPYCLSLAAADDYLDLLTDRLSVLLVYDLAVLEREAEANGYLAEYVGEDMVFCTFTSLSIEECQFAISKHYFSRMFFEFVSPAWILRTQFDLMGKMIKEMGGNADLTATGNV